MDRTIEKLHSYGKKRIELNELRKIIRANDYTELVRMVSFLCDCNVLKPVVNSGSNGMTPMLYAKYHIVPKLVDYSEYVQEVKALHPLIPTDSYAISPEKYIKDRSVIYPLSEYLKANISKLDEPMSENERAYAIWHNEKFLDSSQNLKLLKSLGLLSKLNTYATPEPFFEYRMSSQPQNMLIVENKDTWFSLRKAMLECPKMHTMFNIPIDCIVYGEGKKATHKDGQLQDFIRFNGEFDGNVYYWGDLDYEGIGIYLLVTKYNPSIKFVPFVPAYATMLSKFETMCNSTINKDDFKCSKHQVKPQGIEGFFKHFNPEFSQRVLKLLQDGYYIPQEIVNYQVIIKHLE